jgi:hypothetical protein
MSRLSASFVAVWAAAPWKPAAASTASLDPNLRSLTASHTLHGVASAGTRTRATSLARTGRGPAASADGQQPWTPPGNRCRQDRLGTLAAADVADAGADVTAGLTAAFRAATVIELAHRSIECLVSRSTAEILYAWGLSVLRCGLLRWLRGP